MPIEHVVDPADPRLADYRDVTHAEPRRERGVFVAEGREIVGRLLEAGRFPARSVLVTPPALEALSARFVAHPRLCVYVAPPSVVRAVVGYRFHLGCLAVAERAPETPPAALIDPPGPRLVVALEDLADPDNVGGVFRNALAFGADAVLLSARCADPLYRKAIRVSVGASLTMPFARIDAWADGLARLSAAGYTLVALTPDAAAIDIAGLPAERLGAGRVALFVGAEGAGLGPETRAMADVRVRIPMAPGVDSLNVATAAGIALHRLGRALT